MLCVNVACCSSAISLRNRVWFCCGAHCKSSNLSNFICTKCLADSKRFCDSLRCEFIMTTTAVQNLATYGSQSKPIRQIFLSIQLAYDIFRCSSNPDANNMLYKHQISETKPSILLVLEVILVKVVLFLCIRYIFKVNKIFKCSK